MARRGWTSAAGVGALALVATVALLERADRRWAAAENPCGSDGLLLPPGDRLTVTTDDGARLAGTVAGEGPTVVLSHCWTGRREIWAPVAHRLLSRGHRVVLYDQRGHGSSTVGRDGYTIPRLGADLKAVLDATDARDAILAGHSMGGMAAQSLVAHHPETVADRVAGMVLVATAASGISRGVLDRRLTRIVGSRALERLFTGRYGHALTRGSVGATVCRDHLVATRDFFVACPSQTRSTWLSAMQRLDLRAALQDLDLPAAIAVGSRDTLTPVSRARELARLLPRARLDVHEGLGHMLPLEAPAEVADLISDTARRGVPSLGRAS